MNKPVKNDGTVGKALEVLDAVAMYERPVRFSELLEQSPYPKATLYRFLQTLTNQKFLEYDQTAGIQFAFALCGLPIQHGKPPHLRRLPDPTEQLVAKVGETVHLAQLDNGQVLFIDKLRATDRFQTLAQVGQVAPAYCTGVGKAMLAFIAPKRLQIVLQQQSFYKFTPATHTSVASLNEELDSVRKEGIAFDREEHQQGINSIAAPILSSNGRLIGAISIATATNRFDCEALMQFKGSLLETAKKIGEDATSWQFPS